MSIETIKTILTLVSGLCWTVYIEGIRLGIKDRSYAIPFYHWPSTLHGNYFMLTLGSSTFSGPNFFSLVVGILCSIFDLIYVGMLYRYSRQLSRI